MLHAATVLLLKEILSHPTLSTLAVFGNQILKISNTIWLKLLGIHTLPMKSQFRVL